MTPIQVALVSIKLDIVLLIKTTVLIIKTIVLLIRDIVLIIKTTVLLIRDGVLLISVVKLPITYSIFGELPVVVDAGITSEMELLQW